MAIARWTPMGHLQSFQDEWRRRLSACRTEFRGCQTCFSTTRGKGIWNLSLRHCSSWPLPTPQAHHRGNLHGVPAGIQAVILIHDQDHRPKLVRASMVIVSR
jgi:hypothetical protein